MSKRISLLGSTGSIGRQTLDVIDACGMEVAAITANSSVDRLEEQARRYHPELAVLMDEKAADDLKVRLADTSVKVLAGMDGPDGGRRPAQRRHGAHRCGGYGGSAAHHGRHPGRASASPWRIKRPWCAPATW